MTMDALPLSDGGRAPVSTRLHTYTHVHSDSHADTGLITED